MPVFSRTVYILVHILYAKLLLVVELSVSTAMALSVKIVCGSSARRAIAVDILLWYFWAELSKLGMAQVLYFLDAAMVDEVSVPGRLRAFEAA